MKKLILMILLVFAAVSGNQGWASGSNTVFLTVRIHQYCMSDTAHEVVVNPKLYDYIESVQDRVFIARISRRLYNHTQFLFKKNYDVKLGFEGFEPVLFQYYYALDAAIGFTASGSPIILLSSDDDSAVP